MARSLGRHKTSTKGIIMRQETNDANAYINLANKYRGIREAINHDAPEIVAYNTAQSLYNDMVSFKNNYLNNVVKPYLPKKISFSDIDIGFMLEEGNALGKYTVRAYGSDLFYYEYGTGTIGAEHFHPPKPSFLRPYNSGKTIKKGEKGLYWFKNKTYMRGVPAGCFVYDANQNALTNVSITRGSITTAIGESVRGPGRPSGSTSQQTTSASSTKTSSVSPKMTRDFFKANLMAIMDSKK